MDLLKKLEEGMEYINISSETEFMELVNWLHENDQIVPTRARNVLFEENAWSVKTDEGTFPARPGALLSIEQRADIQSRLMNMLFEKELGGYIDLLNQALKYKNELLDKKEDPEIHQVYLRNGKVLAVHSEKYAHIPQLKIFKAVINKITSRFPDAEYQAGSYTPDLTELIISLSDSDGEIMKRYKHAWISSGRTEEELEAFKPVVRVCTSDSGQSGVVVLPMLRNSRNYVLGERLYTKHSGKNGIENVEKNLDLAFAKAKENLDKMADLMETEIKYPVPTLVRVLEHGKKSIYSYAKEASEDVLLLFKMMYGPEDKVTAFDIYSALCEMEYTEAVSNLKSNSAIQVVEAIYRTLALNWEELDADGKEYLGDRK